MHYRIRQWLVLNIIWYFALMLLSHRSLSLFCFELLIALILKYFRSHRSMIMNYLKLFSFLFILRNFQFSGNSRCLEILNIQKILSDSFWYLKVCVHENIRYLAIWSQSQCCVISSYNLSFSSFIDWFFLVMDIAKCNKIRFVIFV